MKKLFVPVAIAAVLIISGMLAGCDSVVPGGSILEGDTVTEELTFDNFSGIDVGSAFDVTITRADSYKVVITADETLYDYIEVTKSGGILQIYLKPHHIFTDFTIGAKTLKAEITLPVLTNLALSGATSGTMTGFVSTEDIILNISGASSLKIIGGGFDDVKCEVSGASRISGNITADDIRMVVSGASKADLSGTAGDMILEVSGASKADLASLNIDNADIELSGASAATVNVKENLNPVLSGASSLYFYGNPNMGDLEVSGASTIKHK